MQRHPRLHDAHAVTYVSGPYSGRQILFGSHTNAMRFRFSVKDERYNSLTEAAIDDFRLLALDCPLADLQLDIIGDCQRHGGARFAWSRADPGAALALFFARSRGAFTIPEHHTCAGAMLGLTDGQTRLVRTFNSQTGSGMFDARLSAAACHGYFQLLQVQGCKTSNVARPPH